MNTTQYNFPWAPILAGMIFAVAALLLLAGCSSGNRGFWNEIELGKVDLSSIAPGTYRGEYEAGPVKAVVSVEVAGGRIQSIEILEHRSLLGRKAEREIPSRVLSAQSVQVDTVTRATASSMVILKAVEIALTR
jgi:uncharacterized protein with FMN-binding domain